MPKVLSLFLVQTININLDPTEEEISTNPRTQSAIYISLIWFMESVKHLIKFVKVSFAFIM